MAHNIYSITRSADLITVKIQVQPWCQHIARLQLVCKCFCSTFGVEAKLDRTFRFTLVCTKSVCHKKANSTKPKALSSEANERYSLSTQTYHSLW